MSVYLDASVILPLLVEEPSSPAVRTLLATDAPRFVSDFAVAEVGSALSRLVRTRQITAQDANDRLADFDVWRASLADVAEITPSDVRRAAQHVRRFDLMLRAPDAIHLAMASRLDATLITLDRRMAAAARELGVAVAEP